MRCSMRPRSLAASSSRFHRTLEARAGAAGNSRRYILVLIATVEPRRRRRSGGRPMCGIVAVCDSNASSHPASALEAVRRGLATLHHRGPDAQRDWDFADRLVALGHARLSIIDLAGGDQPLANEDQS